MRSKRTRQAFMDGYAKENDITMAEARKQLNPKELKGFKMSLEKFRNNAMHNDNGQWTHDLDNEYIKSRVSRLEALKYQIRGETETLFDTQHEKFDKSLSKAFKDAYYSLSDDLKGFVKGRVDFATFDTDSVHKAIYTKWLDGNNFSSRIWKDKDKLLRELDTNLTQSIIRGDSPDRAIANISKRMNVSKSRSAALYQTEYAHILTQAHIQSIKDAGFEEYEIDENMDNLICDGCAAMHGKHFKLSEYDEGVTAPPFHTRCRGTVTAYFSPEMLADHSEELDRLLDEIEGKGVDNSGGSGIMKLRANLFDRNDDIYLDAMSIEEEPGFEDVCLHGDEKSVQTIIDGQLKTLNAKEFAVFLAECDAYKGGNIRLASCSTGKGENSFAQQLSKELSVIVKAPDDDLYYVGDHYLIGSPYRNEGNWRVFKNGVEVE